MKSVSLITALLFTSTSLTVAPVWAVPIGEHQEAFQENLSRGTALEEAGSFAKPQKMEYQAGLLHGEVPQVDDFLETECLQDESPQEAELPQEAKYPKADYPHVKWPRAEWPQLPQQPDVDCAPAVDLNELYMNLMALCESMKQSAASPMADRMWFPSYETPSCE